MDTSERDHSIGLLIIENKYNVSNKDKEEEIADQNIKFLAKVKNSGWSAQCKNDVAEDSLIDQDSVDYKVNSIHLERKDFEGSMMILTVFVLFFI